MSWGNFSRGVRHTPGTILVGLCVGRQSVVDLPPAWPLCSVRPQSSTEWWPVLGVRRGAIKETTHGSPIGESSPDAGSTFSPVDRYSSAQAFRVWKMAMNSPPRGRS